MMKAGLVSITFRNLSVAEIIPLCQKAGADSLEWGGDIHVPHGHLDTARQVGEDTRSAGLETACYGSYYRSVVSENEGLNFKTVLDTAVALGAPRVRVWAGKTSPDQISKEERNAITANLQEAASMAADKGIRVCLEYHRTTLTETVDSAVRLLQDVNHPNLRTLWQPTTGLGHEEALASLRQIAPWLEYFHVFAWTGSPGNVVRHPLAEGRERWLDYFQTASAYAPSHALLEFVKDQCPDQFVDDTKTLRSWLG